MTDTYDPTALYPCGLGVYCDVCGTEARADFMVNDLTSKAERLALVRAHFNTHGWACHPEADLCPDCTKTHAVASGRARVYHRTPACHAFANGQRLADVECGCNEPCGHRLPHAHAVTFVALAEGTHLRPCKVCRPPLAPATDHGHHPVTGFVDGRALGRICARCIAPHPHGIGRQHVRWPCTTARILNIPTEPTP